MSPAVTMRVVSELVASTGGSDSRTTTTSSTDRGPSTRRSTTVPSPTLTSAMTVLVCQLPTTAVTA